MASLFIGGTWRAGSSGDQREVVNPFDQSVVAKVDEATAEDVAAAVADGALPVGHDAGLPLTWFALDETAAAHDAVEQGALGKVLIRVAE